MTDFSAVAMPITTPGDKQALEVLRLLDQKGQDVVRRLGSTQKSTLDEVSRHAALTSRRVAGEFSMIAAEGMASARSLKSLAIEASNAAFAFGSTGIIAGAVALTGLAIYNMFDRTRKEIEETSKKAQEELRNIRNAGNLGAIGGRFGAATLLYSGDKLATQNDNENDTAFEIRRMGIQAARARYARMQQSARLAHQARGAGGVYTEEEQARDKWLEQLSLIESRYQDLIGLQRELANQEAFAAAKNIEQLREQWDKEHGPKLDDLLLKNRAGVPDITGRSVMGVNFAELGPKMLKGIQESLKHTPTLVNGAFSADTARELERLMQIDSVAEKIGNSFGETLADAIGAGITTAFQKGANVGTAFAALSGAVLQSLGGMFEQIGVAALAGLSFMAKIKAAILGFAPELGLVAAIGLIALGATLKGLGSRVVANSPLPSNAAAPSYQNNYGNYGPQNDYNRLYIPGAGPSAAAGITPRQSLTFFVVGENDPVAQRAIANIMRKAEARGL